MAISPLQVDMFHRKLLLCLSRVCFITYIFPEHMDSKILRMQSASVLIALSVPPLLPAYNICEWCK